MRVRQPSPVGASSKMRTLLIGAGALLTFAVIAFMILRGGLPFMATRLQAVARPTATVTPIPLRLTLYDHLNSITMRSPTEGWIIGSSGQDGHTYLLHFLHGAWTVDPAQIQPMNPTVIKMVSANEGWIAGSDLNSYAGHGVMAHFIGGHVIPVALPDSVGQIESLSMVSPTEGWAVDSRSFPHGNSQILHYSQGVWSVALTLPGNTMLISIDMVSADEGWAAGIGETSGSLWHYAQGSWQQVPFYDPQHADIEQISMLSSDEGWGIGGFVLPHQPPDQYERTAGAIWHYSGGAWQVVKRYIEDPSQLQVTQLTAVQAVGPGEVWVSISDSSGKRFAHGVNGNWLMASAAIRDGITSIAMLSPSDGWAVGYAGQIMQCRDGAWYDYPTH